jgi:hypothetical protein
MISILIATFNRKEMLFALLDSIYKFPPSGDFEIIIVDDFSEVSYEAELVSKYPSIKYIGHTSRLGLIKTRNDAWKAASGDLVAFIDDDNEIKTPDFFALAEKTIKANQKIGILGCRTYYYDNPDTVQFGPTTFNKLTGKTYFLGTNQQDLPEYDGLILSHDVPNAFFVRKDLLQQTGGFSPEIVQTFSEADLAEKVRKLGYSVFQFSELKIYHKSPMMDTKKISARHMGGSPWRFYYLMRNRYVFERKYATLVQKLCFTFIFSHIYTLYYFWHLIILKEWSMLLAGFRGIRDGYIYMFTGYLRNSYANFKYKNK